MANATITFTLKRRPWYRRIWLVPKCWLGNYRILRKTNGRWASAYVGLRLALLLVPARIKIGKREYNLWP